MSIPAAHLRHRSFAFTLVELLVSMAIIVVLLLILVSITDATRRTWLYTSSKIEQFRDAREAFEAVTRRLSQATLNTYWDYQRDSSGNPLTTSTSSYIRQSELRFISDQASNLLSSVSDPSTNATLRTTTHAVFFQGPLGFTLPPSNNTDPNYSNLKNLLNTWGFFIAYGDDQLFRPPFLKTPARSRFRLMEVMDPSESLALYQEEFKVGGSSKYKGLEWFTTPVKSGNPLTTPVKQGNPLLQHPLAENVIALVLLPKLSASDQAAGKYKDDSLAPSYTYSSTGSNAQGTTKLLTCSDANLNPTNQLPPVVQVSLVAMDEVSANRMTDNDVKDLFDRLKKLFTTASNLTADLKKDPSKTTDDSIETYLISKRINYRIFTSNVSIKGAKWSRLQAN